MTQKAIGNLSIYGTVAAGLIIAIITGWLVRIETTNAGIIQTKQQVEDIIDHQNVFRQDQEIMRRDIISKTPLDMTIQIREELFKRMDKQDAKLDKILERL